MARKQTKVYKEAVKKMTAEVDRLKTGAWSGSGGPVVAPAPTLPVVTPKK